MYTKSLLKNGTRLITVPMPSVESVAALVMVATGSRYETPEDNGISHFLEHMIFKGTKNRPSSLAITSLVDGIGGSFNAFTSKEYTGFFIKSSGEHLNLILDVLSDMLLNSLYDEKELEKEKGVIIEEINMYEDQPQARVGELFEKLLYDGSPLAKRISGEKENIKGMTREKIVSYVDKMYHSSSIVVGIAGEIGARGEKLEARELAEKYFGNVNKGPENKYEPAKDTQDKAKSLVYFKQSDQAHLCLGVRAFPLGHPDRYVLSLLSTILGGNMSSRLFLEIREKRGLAYYVHSGAEEYLDAGYFVTQSGLNIDAAPEAIKVILSEYAKLSADLVTTEELTRAKDYHHGKMVLSLEDSYRNASFYASQEVTEKRIETPEEMLANYDKVTAADIQRVAKEIFKEDKLNLAVVGPFKDEGKFDSLLKI